MKCEDTLVLLKARINSTITSYTESGWLDSENPLTGCLLDMRNMIDLAIQDNNNDESVGLPAEEDVMMAIRANNLGGLEFRPECCSCDPSVGCPPCPYCVIHDTLMRIWRAMNPKWKEVVDKEHKD